MRKRIAELRMPVLRLRCRLVLYLLTVVLVVLSLVQVTAELFHNNLGIVFYTLAAVALFLSGCYLAKDILAICAVEGKVRTSAGANPFVRRMMEDYRYRTVMFAVLGLGMNLVFALFNGAVGLYSRSAWYGTLSAYYILLSIMRFLAVGYDRKLSKKENGEALLADEISIYHKCGILFLVLTIALAGMVILMVCEEGGKKYPGFLIYAVAAYTFSKMILSVRNLVKAGRSRSPLLMAARDIGYIDGCVSILSLQTAMFASFGEGQEFLIKCMNGITGTVVSILVLGIGIYTICSADKMKRRLADAGGIGNDKNTCGRR